MEATNYVRVSEEDGQGKVEHIGDHVVQSEQYEGKHRPGHISNSTTKTEQYEAENLPPDRRHLREELSSTASQETSQTNQPVGTNGLQEDLIPFGCHSLSRCNGEEFFLIGGTREHTSIANDNARYKQGSGEIAKEGDEPVSQHQQDRGTTVEGCQSGVHEAASTEVCSGHDDDHQTQGEDQGA